MDEVIVTFKVEGKEDFINWLAETNDNTESDLFKDYSVLGLNQTEKCEYGDGHQFKIEPLAGYLRIERIHNNKKVVQWYCDIHAMAVGLYPLLRDVDFDPNKLTPKQRKIYDEGMQNEEFRKAFNSELNSGE